MQKSEGLRRLYWPERRLQQEVERLIEKVWNAFYNEIMSSLHPPIKGFFCFDPGECGEGYVWSGSRKKRNACTSRHYEQCRERKCSAGEDD